MGEPTSAWGWALPILILAVGLGGLAFALSRLSREAAPGESGTYRVEGLEAELDRDLSEREL